MNTPAVCCCSSGGAGGGGSRGSSAGGSGNDSDTSGTVNKSTAKDNTGAARAALQAVNAYQKGTMSAEDAIQRVTSLHERGLISQETASKYIIMMKNARPGANR